MEFDIKVVDHEQAMAALSAYEVDLVLVFRPPYLANFRPIMTVEQRLVAIMAADHPLASKPSVRFRDCARYPVVLADRSIGGRQLLDEVSGRAGVSFRIVAQSNSFELLRGLVLHDHAISFQIKIGTMPDDNPLGVVARNIDERDVPKANLVLGQLRDRNLPVATAVFAERLLRALDPAESAGRAGVA